VAALQVLGIQNDRLVLPARSRWRTAKLVMTSAEARLVTPPHEVQLSWDDLDGENGWDLTYFALTRGGEQLGLIVTFRHPTPQTDAVMQATHLPGSSIEGAVLRRQWIWRPGSTARWYTTAALTGALAQRHELRAALDDPDTVRRLLHDMAHTPLRAVSAPFGMRRLTGEVSSALNGPFGLLKDPRARAVLGPPRILGRPLPHDPPVAPEALTDLVMARLDNPWARTAADRLTRGKVEQALHRMYLDVTPWPFQALVP